jgi:hypothetical protein
MKDSPFHQILRRSKGGLDLSLNGTAGGHASVPELIRVSFFHSLHLSSTGAGGGREKNKHD